MAYAVVWKVANGVTVGDAAYALAVDVPISNAENPSDHGSDGFFQKRA